MIDIKDVDEEYTVYDYQKDCREVIEDINNRGKRVIIVGGTGLYIKASLYNYLFEKEETNLDYNDLDKDELVERIKKYDIDLNEIDINNKRRLIRLLNKLDNGIESTNNKDELLYPIKVIGLTTDRDYLYKRINDRVDNMINNGLLDEINSLKDKYNNSRVLNSAIGYKEFYDYLFNNKSIDVVIDEIKKDSRHYAKRQYTFFNHQFDTKWFDVNFDNFNDTIDDVYKYISNQD